MATNANPYVINIVPLQGITTGITSSSDTAAQIVALEANIANIQTMVNYETHTLQILLRVLLKTSQSKLLRILT
jgi:hypothetical protein